MNAIAESKALDTFRNVCSKIWNKKAVLAVKMLNMVKMLKILKKLH